MQIFLYLLYVVKHKKKHTFKLDWDLFWIPETRFFVCLRNEKVLGLNVFNVSIKWKNLFFFNLITINSKEWGECLLVARCVYEGPLTLLFHSQCPQLADHRTTENWEQHTTSPQPRADCSLFLWFLWSQVQLQVWREESLVWEWEFPGSAVCGRRTEMILQL